LVVSYFFNKEIDSWLIEAVLEISSLVSGALHYLKICCKSSKLPLDASSVNTKSQFLLLNYFIHSSFEGKIGFSSSTEVY
jgi:hypothetical protein